MNSVLALAGVAGEINIGCGKAICNILMNDRSYKCADKHLVLKTTKITAMNINDKHMPNV